MGLTIGTRMGPYDVTGLLGAGGMGEVYRAHDATLNRDVALKVLPEGLTADAERLARFRREAQVLASLNHPNIAAIYGFHEGAAEAGHYVRALVLELVEGPTLADRLAHGPLPLDEVVPIARQIADALEAAHDQGVIHRDLKPANIKVRPDGTVKVLDFGLAKALEPAGGGDADATASPTITTPAMTRVGMILGTAAYMSPEQAKGRTADKRSDVWAFGCVLYEMLTGRRAFDGEGVTDTLAAVLRGEPDWNALPVDLPAALRTLVQGCLEKDRGRRVGDLAVTRFVLGQPVHAAPVASAAGRVPASRWRSAVTAAAPVLLTAVLIGLAAWRLMPTLPAPIVTRFSIMLPGGQELTTVNRRFIAISPDGSQFVYVANRRLFVRSLSDFEAQEIAGTEDPLGVSNPAFSPDGRSVVFFAAQEGLVKRVAVAGGAAVPVCTIAGPTVFSMLWDSTGIVFSEGRAGISRCPPSGGAPERLVTVQEDEEADGPQVLLDGAALLFTIANVAEGARRWDTAQIVIQTIATGARKTVIKGGADPRYLPTGHLMYSARGIVFAVPFDPGQQTVSGEPVSVVEGVMRSLGGFTGSVQFTTSFTGALLYVPGPVGSISANRLLAFADRAGVVTRLPVAPGQYDHVRASPDGARLAIGTDDGREAIVWIHEVAGKSAMRRLTFGGQNRYPIWSPDGRRVAFQSDRQGDLGLFTQDTDGKGVIERLTRGEDGEAHVPESWAPDGEHLLFSSRKDGRYSLQLLSIRDRKVVPFGGVESVAPIAAVFSPDGRWIAYGSSEGPTESASRGVYVQPFPATSARYQMPKQPGSIDYHPVWGPDGTELFHVLSVGSGQLAASKIATQPAVTFGNPVNLPARVTAGRTSGQMRAHDMLPDGRFVGLVSAVEPSADGRAAPTPELRVVLNWFEELRRLVPTN